MRDPLDKLGNVISPPSEHNRSATNPKEHPMSTAKEAPGEWRTRLLRLSITSTLMGISFAVGVAITAFIAVRLLFPIAASGMTYGAGWVVFG